MSAPKKQTAVDYLVEKLIKLGYLHSKNYGQSQVVKKVIEQAKEMDRQQKMDAYEQGESDGYKQFIINIDKRYESFDQYYNETYSSKVNDECYFEPTNNTSSATICKHCGKEKSLHTILKT